MNVYRVKWNGRCGGIGRSAENRISEAKIYQFSWSVLGLLGTHTMSYTNTPLRLTRPRRVEKLKVHRLSLSSSKSLVSATNIRHGLALGLNINQRPGARCTAYSEQVLEPVPKPWQMPVDPISQLIVKLHADVEGVSSKLYQKKHDYLGTAAARYSGSSRTSVGLCFNSGQKRSKAVIYLPSRALRV